ncbi:MAG: outer membrane lipoprotein chaperone LolA [Gammaproteobacteria bacterium]|nr:outer membrane lipoprotein chaperone LolA [Gammaproteobacteria bacterium]MCW8988563.1 outer membrane lipoprotein chaperone LolA [Gammaproteobacteria bacterium]
MRIKKILLMCTFLLISMKSYASELTDYLNNLHTFQAQFSQKVFSGNNEEKQKSKGLIAVQSPDNFYLEYNEPYKLLYVADGKKLWSYDEDLEQVVVKAQGGLLIDTPAMLLGNPKDLTKSYRIERTGITDGWLWFELTPKKENSNFETVSLAFENDKLIAMEMRDNFGQTTRLEFNNVVKNPILPAKQFVFTPPKGVDVIGQ